MLRPRHSHHQPLQHQAVQPRPVRQGVNNGALRGALLAGRGVRRGVPLVRRGVGDGAMLVGRGVREGAASHPQNNNN